MKTTPFDPPPDPERPPRPPRATTTRFLRLTPAPDVAPVAPLPSTSTRPLPAPAAASTVTTPVRSVPTSGAASSAPSGPEPAAAVSASAPSITSPPKIESTPLPHFPIFSPPAATGSQRLRLPPVASPTSAPENQPDDRPMRLTTKRLPNVFASAPSARWAAPTSSGTRPLRLIPPSVIAAPAPSPIEPEVETPTLASAETKSSIPISEHRTPTAQEQIAPEEMSPEESLLEPSVPDPSLHREPATEELHQKPVAREEPDLEQTVPEEHLSREVSPASFLRHPSVEEHQPEFHLEPAAVEPIAPAPETELVPEPSPPVPLRPVQPITFAPKPLAVTPAPPIEPPRSTATPGFTPAHKLTPPPVPLSRLAKDERARSSLGRGFWTLLLVLCLLLIVLLYLFGLTPRIVAGRELDHEQKLSSERIVAYGVARLATPHVELPLPGTIEASQQAALYARTSGYVKKWFVDIGDQVVAGQLLAELDTPEVDQQLAQAKAAEAEAGEELKIAQSVAQRWDNMAQDRAVAKEDADQKDAANDEAQAAFTAAQANVARLTDLENFKEIRAPFTGKITYRNIDIGSLVSAGTGTPNSELFRVAQTDPVRVEVDVPESDAPAIKTGVPADVQVNSYPGRVFHGEVVRDAGALSDSSRTLHTEIRVANPDGALLPGAFAEVRLQLLDSAPAVLIPANALIVNSTGTSVAILQDHYGRDVVHYTPVRVGRDFGTEVEILENVHQGDRLVTNPPTDLTDGAAVTSKPADTPPTPAVASPSPAPSPRA